MTNAESRSARPMLNLYPDSVGGTLADAVSLLRRPELRGVFDSLYVLPSVFNTDLDRGFSVIDYGIDTELASEADLEALRELGIELKLDFILNHASVLSPQFQHLTAHGEDSPFRDFFIDWNAFWEGEGEMTPEGYVQPHPEHIAKMFFRKPGLPILMVRFPDGRDVPYWNTFYQEVVYPRLSAHDLLEHLDIQYTAAQRLAELVNKALDDDVPVPQIPWGRYAPFAGQVSELLESRRRYMGQMDLNIASPLVWEFYEETLHTLAGYGASIVRLDAFAYAPKEPGRRNFLNDPETWDVLARVRDLAAPRGLELLPEIHATYAEGTHERIASEGFMTYDFFLPGLVLDAFETGDTATLVRWAREQRDKKIRTVTMLGCHDGIPLLDLKGLVPDERIDQLIEKVVSRGGYVKNLHGNKEVYYQVNATYFSALGEDERSMLLARALHLFMPGKPQVWYLDLFGGTNDHAAVEAAGPGGHKEINRTNLTVAAALSRLDSPLVAGQLELLRFRHSSPAFGFDAKLVAEQGATEEIVLRWEQGGSTAVLEANLATKAFRVTEGSGEVVFEQH